MGTQTQTCHGPCPGGTHSQGWVGDGVEISHRFWDGVCVGSRRGDPEGLQGGGDVRAVSVLTRLIFI